MYKIKIAEVVPGKKVVWEVIDAYQSWVKEPAEWVGTKILWEIDETRDDTVIHFTHVGLVPKLECYDNCVLGWDFLMLKSLSGFLNSGKGQPQPKS